jgi:hypothetical protein
MVNTALPAAIQSRVQPIYTLLENKYYLDWINENIIARGARAIGTGLWKGGDAAVIDGFAGQWFMEDRRLGFWRGALAPDGLSVPLCVCHDFGRVCADDVFRLAQQVGRTRKMSLLSLAIWTPIVFGVVLLALGRDEQAGAVRWIALIGAVDQFPGDSSLVWRLQD